MVGGSTTGAVGSGNTKTINIGTGGAAGSLEYVLKPLTNYLFRLTNVNGTAHAASLTLEWYE